MEILEAQKRVDSFTVDNGLQYSVEVRVLDLASEVGEIGKEFLKGSEYGCKTFRETSNCQAN